ncbi:MAG TPA: GNAT family N-acetyltransferase, partial [Jatrophihabitantaceae bacterium]|nr:GNAT family N-acetyltransferase [Jatrophihabitantaceae bacterium]
LLVLDRPSDVAADPHVRRARFAELDRYLPAAIAMLSEELELPPFAGAVRATYRARLAELIAAGRAFVRLDSNGEIAFKAELGAVSRRTCQIQGVWVRPDLRGRGIATAAMSSVVRHALMLAPSVSLYVNDFNLAARTVYDRLGMRQVATLATVMF